MKLILTALLVFLIGTLSAHAEDRLLPTAQASNMSVTFRQDGRAVYVSLLNSSEFVVTSARVACTRGELSVVDGKLSASGYWQEDAGFKVLRLLPGKSAEAYLEANVKIERCTLVDVRGREKSFYELF